MEAVSGAISEFRTALQRIYSGRLRDVYLFGSQARGDASQDSDVDILVVLDAVDGYLSEIQRTSEAAADIALRYGLDLSWVFVTEEELAQGRVAFLGEAMGEAVRVG